MHFDGTKHTNQISKGNINVKVKLFKSFTMLQKIRFQCMDKKRYSMTESVMRDIVLFSIKENLCGKES